MAASFPQIAPSIGSRSFCVSGVYSGGKLPLSSTTHRSHRRFHFRIRADIAPVEFKLTEFDLCVYQYNAKQHNDEIPLNQPHGQHDGRHQRGDNAQYPIAPTET